jgi:glycogen(starch) synthase
LTIVTPWYPTADKPYGGSFVREWLRALAVGPADTAIVHLEMVEPDDPRQPGESSSPEGRLIWVPVKVGHNLPRAAAAKAQFDAITPAAISAIRAAETCFAHVTMPTGWAVAEVMAPDQRLVLVEHASYVPQLLARADARQRFGQAVARAEAVLSVGEVTAGLIRRVFPEAGGKIWAVGNPLDTAAFPLVDHGATGDFQHWLYAGNLLASKGVFDLLAAFAAFAHGRLEVGTAHQTNPQTDPQSHPQARLTVAGQGPAEAELRAAAQRLGLANQVNFAGGLERAALVQAMAESDLLVHLSPSETFGLAPLEALLTGLPVLVVRNAGTTQTMTPAIKAGRAVMLKGNSRAGGRVLSGEVVDGIGQLSAAVRLAGPEAAYLVRRQLADRYGLEPFGALERRVAAGLPPYLPSDQALPALVAVAGTASAWTDLSDAVRSALWQGRPVVVAGETSLKPLADPRIEFLELPSGRLGPAIARALWLVRAAPLKLWRLALRLSLRLGSRLGLRPGAREGSRLGLRGWLAGRLDHADQAARALNTSHRLTWAPRIESALAGRSLIKTQAEVVRRGTPPGAERLVPTANLAALRRALGTL